MVGPDCFATLPANERWLRHMAQGTHDFLEVIRRVNPEDDRDP
jgi:hypothetical protein